MKNHTLVLGLGIASSAYVSLLDYNKVKTSVVGSIFDYLKVNSIKKNKKDKLLNLSYSKRINFFQENEISKIDKSSINFIIIGTNTHGINWTIKILNELKVDCPVLLITKGIILFKNKLIPLSDYYALKCFNSKIIMSAGPCLAKELINFSHTRTLFASKKISFALHAKKILENDFYHPEIALDIKGAEICAAIKNIYAIIIGSSNGQTGHVAKKNNNYFNTSSGLFEQSLKEMKLIVKKFGGEIKTVSGLAGAGDLFVSILGGRNAKLGFFLGKGLLYNSIIKKQMRGVTVEGADLVKTSGTKILHLVGQKKLPLLKSLLKAINGNLKLKIDWKQFTF